MTIGQMNATFLVPETTRGRSKPKKKKKKKKKKRGSVLSPGGIPKRGKRNIKTGGTGHDFAGEKSFVTGKRENRKKEKKKGYHHQFANK